MPRRVNPSALVMSALLVGGGALAVLRWQPSIPGIGLIRSEQGSSVGVTRQAPTTSGPGCREDRRVVHGGYRFLPACYGHAPSADGAYLVVKNAGMFTGVGLVRGGSGESLDDLGTLDAGRPFTVFWSPAGYRFFANQQRSDELDRFLAVEVVRDRVVTRDRLGEAAQAVLRARRPCLTPADVSISGVRWSGDGRRIVLIGNTRREACGGTGAWRSVWMIGDFATGRIDPRSVRARAGRDPLPSDGPYAAL